MTIIISQDPRSIKAVAIAVGAGQWLRCHGRDGRKFYGVPSQTTAGAHHFADCQRCTCVDFLRHQGQPCKHILAVRLHVERVKAQQSRPRRKEVRAA